MIWIIIPLTSDISDSTTVIPIIIVNWNGWDDTLECIESAFKTIDIDYHIHLIDNGSDNDEGHKLSDLYRSSEHITVHQYDQNYGFTGAHLKIWEELLSQQEHSHIALLNNDTIVDPRWLYMLHQMATTKSCGIVAAKMIQYYNPTLMDNAGHKMLNTGEILPIGYGEPIERYTEPLKNMGGCGGAALYSTEMLGEIGFFDHFFSTGYEDAEFGLRAVVAGYESWYCPSSLVWHKGGRSLNKISDPSFHQRVYINILYTFFKNLHVRDIKINLVFMLMKNFFAIIILCLTFNFSTALALFKSLIKIIAIKNHIIHYRSNRINTVNRVNKKLSCFIPHDLYRTKRIIFTYISN